MMTTVMEVGIGSRHGDAPFVYLFETEAAKYAYDVNSRRIMEIDDLRWALLSDWKAGDEEVARRAGGGATADEARAVRQEIEALGARGEMFSPIRASAIRAPFLREELQKELTCNCHQLILNVSEQCNLRCSYCYYGGASEIERRHSSRMMTWETAKKALDFFLPRCQGTLAVWKAQIKDPSLARDPGDVERPCVGFYGGEPLMNWPLVKRVIEYVRSLEDGDAYLLNFTTNATLLTPERSDFLGANHVVLLVSLDGPKELHDRYRRFTAGGPTWDIVSENLRYMKEKMPDYYKRYVGLSCVLAPPLDLRDVVAFVENWELNTGLGMRFSALGDDVPSCFWEPIDRLDRRIGGQKELWQEYVAAVHAGRIADDYAPSGPREARRLRALRHLHDRRLLKVYGRTKNMTRGKALLPETVHTNFGMCPPGRERLFVQVDGRFCPCERVPSQAVDFIIGDLEHGFDIDAIMRLGDGNAALLEDKCRDCWNLAMCTTICKSLVGGDGRLSRESKLKECEISKRTNHTALVDMCTILEKNPNALSFLDKF
jgi:uncharacterized protein